NPEETDTGMPASGTLAVTGNLLRRFLPGDLLRITTGLLLLLGSSGAALLQPWPLKLVLDCVVGSHEPPLVLSDTLRTLGNLGLVSAHPKTSLLLVLCIGLLLIESLLAALHLSSAYLLNSVALRMVFKLRSVLFDHVQRQSLSFHDARAVGDSLYRI